MPATQPLSILSDTLIGTADPDYFEFLTGPVEVWTYAGDDQVFTGDYDDVVQLGEGDDHAETGGGNDVVYADGRCCKSPRLDEFPPFPGSLTRRVRSRRCRGR